LIWGPGDGTPLFTGDNDGSFTNVARRCSAKTRVIRCYDGAIDGYDKQGQVMVKWYARSNAKEIVKCLESV